ncbi:aromatic amino acid transaminase [Porticoccus sp. GXU_MW_L64]
MFSQITQYQDDPIEGFQTRLRTNSDASSLDLGLGIYRNEQGEVVVFDAVLQAEKRLVAQAGHKGYRSPLGNQLYIEQMERMLFGELLDGGAIQGVASAQTPGAGAACRLAAEYIKSLSPNSRVWASLPNWGHQIDFFGNSGLDVKYFPYYDIINAELVFDQMLATLREAARPGDVLLLHGCCHNPTGADPSLEQWSQLADLCCERGLLPFVDVAYQGFGDGIEEDLKGMQVMAAKVPEMMVGLSSSKSFTVYRERAGLLSLIFNESAKYKGNAYRKLRDIARGLYFMAPDHGAEMVATILADDQLRQSWRDELDAVRLRIYGLRTLLRSTIEDRAPDFNGAFLEQQKGMFSCLPVSPDQQAHMETEHGIYMLPNARINFAALAQSNVNRVAQAFLDAKTLQPESAA